MTLASALLATAALATAATGNLTLHSGHTRQEVELDQQFRAHRLQVPAGARRLVLERTAGLVFLDQLAAFGPDGARLGLSADPALAARDLEVLGLDAPLAVRLDRPAPAGTTLRLVGRGEGDAPVGSPFVLPAGSYPPTAGGPALSYRVGSAAGRFEIDGRPDAKLPAAALRAPTHPGTGHPDAWATAYLLDDGESLFAAFDFASDNTSDGGADFAELWVERGGSAPLRFRVSSGQRAHGAVAMVRTEQAPYAHKFYEFRVPLASLGARPGDSLRLKLAAYGTAAYVGESAAAIARDGGSVAFRRGPIDGEVRVAVVAYAEDRWSAPTDLHSAAWVPGFAASADLRSLLLRSDSEVVSLHQLGASGWTRVDTALSTGSEHFWLSDEARVAAIRYGDAPGLYERGADGSYSLALALPNGAFGLTAAGDRAYAWDASYDDPAEFEREAEEWVRVGALPVSPNLACSPSLAPGGEWLTYPGAGNTLHLLQRGEGAWQEVTTGLEAEEGTSQGGCPRVADDGTLLWAATQNGPIQRLRPGAELETFSLAEALVVHELAFAGNGTGFVASVYDTASWSYRILYFGDRALTLVEGAELTLPPAPGPSSHGLLSASLRGNFADLVTVDELEVALSGTLAAAQGVGVRLLHDVDADGTAGEGDVQLGASATPVAGVVSFSGLDLPVANQADTNLLAVVDLPEGAAGTLQLSLARTALKATTATTGWALQPAGRDLTGPLLQIDPPPVPDAGNPEPDAGDVPDAGPLAPDAGAALPDAGPGSATAEESCGCSAGGEPLGMMAFLLLGLSRRRRS